MDNEEKLNKLIDLVEELAKIVFVVNSYYANDVAVRANNIILECEKLKKRNENSEPTNY